MPFQGKMEDLPEIKAVRLPPVDDIHWPEQLCSDGPKPLDPAKEYVDVTDQLQALAETVSRLEDLILRVAKQAAQIAKRQAEMRADLLRAGVFEKKSSIIMPGDRN